MANVTLQDVEQAVAQLEAAGLPVSVASVRGQLGRGSATTITKLLRDVREARSRGDELPDELDRASPPAGVIDKIAAAARAAGIEAFVAIAEPINQQILAARAEIENERASMKADMAQVLADAGEAVEAAEALRLELVAVQALHATASAELLAVRKQLDERASAEKTESERRAAEVAQLRQQLDNAQAEGRRAQDKAEAAIAESAELRGRLAALKESTSSKSKRR